MCVVSCSFAHRDGLGPRIQCSGEVCQPGPVRALESLHSGGLGTRDFYGLRVHPGDPERRAVCGILCVAYFGGDRALECTDSFARVQMLYTNWQSTGNSFEGAFGGYDDVSSMRCLMRPARHVYIHACMHACMHECMFTHIHTYTQTYIHT